MWIMADKNDPRNQGRELYVPRLHATRTDGAPIGLALPTLRRRLAAVELAERGALLTSALATASRSAGLVVSPKRAISTARRRPKTISGSNEHSSCEDAAGATARVPSPTLSTDGSRGSTSGEACLRPKKQLDRRTSRLMGID